MLLKLLGFREELPLDYRPGNPAESRTSDEVTRRRELTERNDRNLARYFARPEAQRRFALHLRIQQALRRGLR